MVTVEAAQSAEGLIDGRVLQPLLVAQGDEKIEHLAFGQGGDVTSGDGLMEPAHPCEIGNSRAWRDVSELDMTHELLIPLRRGEGGVAVLAGGFVCIIVICFHSACEYRQHCPASLASSLGAAKRLRSTSRDAPTGHKLFNFISTSLQPRRWAHIKR